MAAAPERVWETVADPHHLPRWWPRVVRVEAVSPRGFTQVLGTERGRAVRADFRVVESRAPRMRRWAQELAGSPFERILDAAETEVRLAPAGGGTRVTIIQRQRLRGTARLGAWMFRRATRTQLDEALHALEELHAG